MYKERLQKIINLIVLICFVVFGAYIFWFRVKFQWLGRLSLCKRMFCFVDYEAERNLKKATPFARIYIVHRANLCFIVIN